MEIDEFVARFTPAITVGVNWQRLLELRVPVEEAVIRSRDELGDVALPWYLNSTGNSCNYDEEDATRLYVQEAAEMLDGVLGHRLAVVEEKAADLTGSAKVAIPAYSRGGPPILLDGCHRTLALMRSSELPRVELYTVLGPDDPTIFLDLVVPDRRLTGR